MSDMSYGATPEEWEAFASFNLRDLLPTVCDPNVRPSAGSSVKGELDKIPSRCKSTDGWFGVGFHDWPNHVTTSYHDWALDSRHGICMVMRTVHAFDIDIDNIELSRKLEGAIREFLGIDGMLLPRRTRKGSGKLAMLFRLSDGPEFLAHSQLTMPGGMGKMELLFHKQQMRVAGRHRSGARLEWPEGIPRKLSDVPAIPIFELHKLMHYLRDEFNAEASHDFAPDGTQIHIKPRYSSQVDVNDPIVNFLHENDLVRALDPDGKVHVWCPWRHRHTSGDSISEATFFPSGLGGRTEPGFRCHHAGCKEFNSQNFLTTIGYEDTQFPVVEMTVEQETRPVFVRETDGSIKPTLTNLVALLKWPEGIGWHIRYDSFKDLMSVSKVGTDKWVEITENFITMLRLKAPRLQFKEGATKELMRDALEYVAENYGYDSLQVTLSRLSWDGVPRIDTFHTRVLGLEDTPYNKAVFRYMWTALAGRALSPGVKADMVPILIGRQGLRKSSLVEALAPSLAEYASVTLDVRDSDLARQLRGKVVAEWDELRGLNTRDADAIKGWITHRADDWTPKFKEYTKTMPRRFLLIGTANEKRVLSDPTGARRFLPVRVSKTIDVDYVVEHRDQLWAEAMHQFKQGGVAWREAEQLAGKAHRLASSRDMWTDSIEQWMQDQGTRQGFSSTEILVNACSVPVSRCSRGEHARLTRVMTRMGWSEDDDGKWYCNLV